MTINISGGPPNSLAGGLPAPPYNDNNSGPQNPACFLTLDSPSKWDGQSFTPNSSYNLGSVELWLKKGPGDNVGIVKVVIRTVDGDGHPEFTLNRGEVSDADISESYSWVSFPDLLDFMETAAKLDANTKYCIVLIGEGTDVDNTLIWGCSGDGGDYPNGDVELSLDSGGSWSTDTTKDMLFRCYPTPFLDNYSGSRTPFSITKIDRSYRWAGQTFTAMKSYPLTRIDIKGKKNVGMNVGPVVVALYGVDGDGHPDILGGVLADGIILDADVPENYAWMRADFSAYDVVAGTKYAIVVHGFSFNAGNYIFWNTSNWVGDSAYAGGDKKWSIDSGGAWVTTTDWDQLFRCYSA